MPEPKCVRGECDQRIRCAFYCWWNPTMVALNHERDQWAEGREARSRGNAPLSQERPS